MNNQIPEMIALILSMIGQPNLDINVTLVEGVLDSRTVAAHVIFKSQEPSDPHNIIVNSEKWDKLPERLKMSTLFHEVAHVVTVDRGHDIYDNANHKKDFRRVCKELRGMVELPPEQSRRTCRASFDPNNL